MGAAFFEEDASDERKRRLRENLAALSAGATPGQTMFAQTPMRFFDARLDAAPLFAESVVRPRLLGHLLGTLAPAWDVTAGAGPLRVPILIAHGRYDYVVPYRLWDGVAERLPGATFRLFERSGHQPFFDEPDRFAEVVTDWMRAGPIGRSTGPTR
jgi:proline iminopeptidase